MTKLKYLMATHHIHHQLITEDLARKIDEYIEKSKQGYRSRAEFISEAIKKARQTNFQ